VQLAGRTGERQVAGHRRENPHLPQRDVSHDKRYLCRGE
jgi:hypothetical protein